MKSVLFCTLSLAIANFVLQLLLPDVPDYGKAMADTLDQFLAIVIYHYIWVEA